MNLHPFDASVADAAELTNPSGRQLMHWLEGSLAPHWRPRLLVREQLPSSGERTRPVLYVHGATFPSASSVMARLGGRSWADALNDEGFDLFALDFAGFGGSARYPAMRDLASRAPPLGRAETAAEQVERAIDLIRRETGEERVSIIAHSWGSMPAALFAAGNPQHVDRLILFGPILAREGPVTAQSDAWSLVTIEAQHTRFNKDVPPGFAPILEDFPDWAEAYLDTDPESRTRQPPSVMVPFGPEADVAAAWSGQLPYDPRDLTMPVCLVRGEWDSSSNANDARWFMDRLPRNPASRLVTIPKATHLAHLEVGRHVLHAAVSAFLTEPLERP